MLTFLSLSVRAGGGGSGGDRSNHIGHSWRPDCQGDQQGAVWKVKWSTVISWLKMMHLQNSNFQAARGCGQAEDIPLRHLQQNFHQSGDISILFDKITRYKPLFKCFNNFPLRLCLSSILACDGSRVAASGFDIDTSLVHFPVLTFQFKIFNPFRYFTSK